MQFHLVFVLQLFLYIFLKESAAQCSTFNPPEGQCLAGCMFDSDCIPGKQTCCTVGCWSSCENLSKCQLEQRKYRSRAGPQPYIPRCDEDGNYMRDQCGRRKGRNTCWQVDQNGKKIPNSERDNTRQPPKSTSANFPKFPETNVDETESPPVDTYTPIVVPQGKCFKKRKRRLKLKRADTFIPRCKLNGKFKRVQCHNFKSHRKCWCVDTTSGKEIPGTRVRKGRPNCRPGQCGRKLYRRRRVVGGFESVEGAWPWQAALFLNGTQHRCGGAVIKSSWVITAAHCFNPFRTGFNHSTHKRSGDFSSTNPADWEVRLGEHSFLTIEGTEKRLKVLEIIIHPNYIPGNLTHPGDYDVALVRIHRSVKLGRTVNSICLPDSFKYFKPGKRCAIAGWGKTSWNGSVSPVLRTAWVDLVSRRVCNSDVSYGGRISKRFVCAGFKEGGIDACAYDSGGPLMCSSSNGQWVLAGIISWGEKCALPHKYGVYSNVHHFIQWISNKLKIDR